LEHYVGDDSIAQHDQNRGSKNLGEDRGHDNWVKVVTLHGPLTVRNETSVREKPFTILWIRPIGISH
jgi:hypothetical protein